jgi:hypothetical protein
MRMGLEDMAECFETATGVEMTWEELYRAGERIRQLEKAMQLRYGFRKEHDGLPDHWYDTPVESGQFEGAYLDKAEFLEELEKFYELRGWNKHGFPLRKTLIDLDMRDVAKVLAEEGLLAGAAAKRKKTKKKRKKTKKKKKKKTARGKKKQGSGVRGQGSGPAPAP